MTAYSYCPGEWTALAHNGRAALLDPAIDQDSVHLIWDSLASGGGSLESWLEVLAGNGLAALPSFGFVEPSDDGVRVVVRGTVVAIVDDYEISAGGMRTWREHVAATESVVVLQVAAGEAIFPLVGGVVLASSLHVGELAPDAGLVAAVPVAEVADEADQAIEPAVAIEAEAGAAAGESDADVEAVPEEEGALDPEAEAETEVEDGEGDAEFEDEVASGPEEPVVAREEESELALADGQHIEGALSAVIDSEGVGEGDDAAADGFEEDGQEAASLPISEEAAPALWAPRVEPAASQWGPPAVAEAVTPAVPAAGFEDVGDHDGYTMRASDLASGNVDNTLAPRQDEVPDASAGLLAMQAQLSLSTGHQIELDRPVLIGRAPESSRFGFGETPRLVTVPSPQQDISRTHVEIKLEGDHVLITDLRSTNGTVVILPGAPPRRLHPGESVPVPTGTVVDLGDGVTAVVAPPNASTPV